MNESGICNVCGSNTGNEAERLRVLTDDGLRKAYEIRTTLDAANWADIKCIRAVIGKDETSESIAIVWIAEASPNASRLCDFIQQYLLQRGFAAEVITEW